MRASGGNHLLIKFPLATIPLRFCSGHHPSIVRIRPSLNADLIPIVDGGHTGIGQLEQRYLPLAQR